MKKYIIGLCIAVLLLASPRVTFAADALYRMLHADEVESFKQDQDAMILGQLMDKQGDTFKVKIIKVFNGRVSSDLILVADDFNYGWDQLTPRVGDFCVLSLKKQGAFYKKAWGIFKADSGDYRTLRLDASNASTSGLLGDLACIQWYVNSGGQENDFSGVSGTYYVKRPNDQEVQIYPVPTTDAEAPILDNAQTQISSGLIQNNKSRSNPYSYVLLIIAIFLIGIGTAVFVRSGRRKE
ncbi:hypothetical protein [Desulfitobacterium sp.]|uniref:hypothetical protein n=1 Tax=Desulfitobacterium sp. TaxID=49981 RepID=UPI002C7843DF|nr:hypothetical protein [Desulfitobacterium sp.]HVJ47990.1 hypothetical protein [Desulfitobacterium sp.]